MPNVAFMLFEEIRVRFMCNLHFARMWIT